MKRLFLIPVVFLLSSCVKKQGSFAKPPIDSFDTTLGRMSFFIDGNETNSFHVSGQKINNKLVVNGNKNKVFENRLVPFHAFTLCFDNNSLSRQRLFKVNSSIVYSDSSKGWAQFGTMADDGDVVCELFDIRESDSTNNWVQIKKQQNDFGEVWGNFRVSFSKVQDCKSKFYSDDLVVTNGYFHVFVK